uniref:DUF4781 domain-containing protein n=1 Tax=Caenorhabditis japonica TaxID=281687 RepID=A0A8R1I3I6_CAEJA
MGNTLAGELPSSWDDYDVKKWKEEARKRQACIYLQFEGSQFHDISELNHALRITKICFAIYGPPTDDAKDLETAYSSEQREYAGKIYNKIYEVWREAPEKGFKLGFLFIFCKEQVSEEETKKGNVKEYQVPLFRLLWERKPKADGGYTDTNRYIDTACRVYDSADDWKNNNTMPMMKYCHPKNLFYTCHPEYTYKFDPDEEPTLGFNTSPACDLSSRIFRSADVVVSVVGMSVGVASLFTPAGFISGPILLGVGGTSGVYGFGRAIHRLYDKGSHGESLSDLESVLLFLSIAASPLHVLSGFANARLASGAAAGRIFSQSQRVLATLLIWSTLGIDSFAFILNLSNLINKYNDDKLTTLDVLQFSVTTLFFANTLIQPKTAYGVIERAQQQRIDSISKGMSDETAKDAFKAFLDKNKNSGDIKDTSKIIRTLNKMEDSNAFFKTSGNDVTIGGRKGNTVLMKNGDPATRVNPNKFVRDGK